MQGLLPDNLLEQLLSETGAYEGIASTRLVSTGEFKRFSFNQKQKAEFDANIFGEGFDLARNKIEEDWKNEYFDSCELTRTKEEVRDLSKYKFRDGALCCRYTCDLISEAFVIYIQRDTFYYLLNQYLGGGPLGAAKQGEELTEIEVGLFTQLATRLGTFFQMGLSSVSPLKLKLAGAPVPEAEHKEDFKHEYLVTELEFSADAKPCKFALAVPVPLLTHLKDSQENDSAEIKRLDPLWQKVVTEACLDSQIELTFKLDQVGISFGQSVAIREGDTYPWSKADNQVLGYYRDDLRMAGTIGVVDGNFAVRIDVCR